MIRVGFFGTPTLARDVLQDLLHAPDIEVVCIVTNPDKPFGREQILLASPVKELAMSSKIPVLTPTKIRENQEFFDTLRGYSCDYFVVVAYGRILPLELLQIPKKKSLNIHGSLLPKYRGASPIQAALLHGEKETGVTIMEMSEGMDEGDILKIRTIPLSDDETSETLFAKFGEISGSALIQTLRELEMGGITPLPQIHSLATYCKKIDKEDGRIDWSKSAAEIYHRWQAYTPWPGIYTLYEGKRLLLENVSCYYPTENGEPERVTYKKGGLTHPNSPGEGWGFGQVIKLEDGMIGVQCGKGILTLQQVKLEGKKSQSIKDFLNGNQKFISSML